MLRHRKASIKCVFCILGLTAENFVAIAKLEFGTGMSIPGAFRALEEKMQGTNTTTIAQTNPVILTKKRKNTNQLTTEHQRKALSRKTRAFNQRMKARGRK